MGKITEKSEAIVQALLKDKEPNVLSFTAIEVLDGILDGETQENIQDIFVMTTLMINQEKHIARINGEDDVYEKYQDISSAFSSYKEFFLMNIKI